MGRPRKSTKDEMLDTFADFDIDSQELLIDNFDLIHRQAKRRQRRETEAEQDVKEEQPA